MTTVRTDDIGKARGISGRVYRFAGGGGECGECGTPFGARFVLGDADPLPALTFAHHPDGTHRLTMTGDSEAARALNDGQVIATAGGSADGFVS